MERWNQILTDVVYGPGTEFSVELFGPEASKVMDGKGPKMEHVVPGKRVSLLNHHHFGSHQGELYGGPQAAGTSSDDEALNKTEWQIDLITDEAQRDELQHGNIFVILITEGWDFSRRRVGDEKWIASRLFITHPVTL